MTDTCPFGEELQRYWELRYTYFSRFDEGIKIDETGLYSVTPEKVANEIAARIQSKTIVDAFGGVGGNAIAFASAGKTVHAIELDPKRKAMIENNARIYEVEGLITVLQGDFFEKAATVDAGAVYLDPAWGGPSYRTLKRFTLGQFSPHGRQILNFAFERFKEVVLRVPNNFDLDELTPFRRDYEVLDNVAQSGRRISQTVYFQQK